MSIRKAWWPRVWRDRYRARQEAKESARRERVAKLWEELNGLFTERASLPPEQHSAVTARIEALGREIAEFNALSLPAPAASWG